jgi:hypothetical protein
MAGRKKRVRFDDGRVVIVHIVVVRIGTRWWKRRQFVIVGAIVVTGELRRRDPDGIGRLARRIGRNADELRLRAHRLGAAQVGGRRRLVNTLGEHRDRRRAARRSMVVILVVESVALLEGAVARRGRRLCAAVLDGSERMRGARLGGAQRDRGPAIGTKAMLEGRR